MLSLFGEPLERSLSQRQGLGAWQGWIHQRGEQGSCRHKAWGASAPGTGVPG